MSGLAVYCITATGVLAGIPVAAAAYSAPAHGRSHPPRRWWRGDPAPPRMVIVVCVLTGGSAWLVATRLPPSPAVFAFCITAVLGVGLAIIDLRHRRLPSAWTGAIGSGNVLFFAVAFAIDGRPAPLLRALAVGSVVGTALLVIALLLPGQLGLGDVVLASILALNLAWLNLAAATIGILGGLLLQGFVAFAVRMGTAKITLIPMGPALIAGWLGGVVLHSTVVS